MLSQLRGVRIAGVASTVPAGVRTIEDEANILGADPTRLKRLQRDIGISRRHVTLKGECTSDLCEHAARFLLSRLTYDPADIDALLLVTQTPDYFQPPTSYILHGRLGLNRNCATYDLNLGCSGYVYGLWLSSLMLSAGNCTRILLLAGDTMSRCVSPYDRAVMPLFGDAGSATLIERTPDSSTITFALHSDGMQYKHLIIPAGAFRKRPSTETARLIEREDGNLRSEEHLYMNGAEVFNFSIREVPPLIREVLSAANWTSEEVDYYIFHQANKFIILNIARRLAIPVKKSPHDVFEKYGNQSSASIPVTICEDLSSVVEHDSAKVVLAGFGAGLSWAACSMVLGPMNCFPVTVLNPETDRSYKAEA